MRTLLAQRLAPDAAQRLASETTKYPGRRLAISVDGMVRVAPVVNSPLTNGVIQIGQGALPTAEDSRSNADELVRDLSGVGLPGRAR